MQDLAADAGGSGVQERQEPLGVANAAQLAAAIRERLSEAAFTFVVAPTGDEQEYAVEQACLDGRYGDRGIALTLEGESVQLALYLCDGDHILATGSPWLVEQGDLVTITGQRIRCDGRDQVLLLEFGQSDQEEEDANRLGLPQPAGDFLRHYHLTVLDELIEMANDSEVWPAASYRCFNLVLGKRQSQDAFDIYLERDASGVNLATALRWLRAQAFLGSFKTYRDFARGTTYEQEMGTRAARAWYASHHAAWLNIRARLRTLFGFWAFRAFMRQEW
jgi:hypothetical protein